tara:strand:+ start:410 stop:1222 length:813 start_codon:yes stop_codon:yes gene_type:complete
MPNWIPLDSKRHKDYGVKPVKNFGFTQNDNLCTVLIAELRNVIHQTPVVFAKNAMAEYELCSLQGLEDNKNYLVGENGVWKGSYIPSHYRSYPFIMATEKNSDKKILCFDETAGLVAKHEKSSEFKLFDEDAKPAKHTLKILEFFKSVDENRKITGKAVKIIDKEGLLEDWTLKIKAGSQEKVINGIKKINFTKFNSLNPEILKTLKDAGALEIIFGHYFSMSTLEKLIKLPTKKIEEGYKSHKDRALARKTTAEKKEVDNLVQNLLLDD